MASSLSEDAHGDERTGDALSAISREIVGIYSEYFGRGPTKARTLWRDDLVVCVLKGVFIRAEQMLVDGGRFIQVRDHRQAFHDEVEPIFREVVERHTGHAVESFLTQVSKDGTAIEVFTFAAHDRA